MSRSKWNYKNKNRMRSLAVEYKGKTAECALMLPGIELRCVKEALKNRTINKKTFLVAVEGDKIVAEKIRKRLIGLGFKEKNFHIHDKVIDKLKLSKVLDGKKIDFVFADYCGLLSEEIAYWTGIELNNNLEKKWRAGFTFYTQDRTSYLLRYCDTEMKESIISHDLIQDLVDVKSKWLVDTTFFENNEMFQKNIITSQVIKDCLYNHKVKMVASEQYRDKADNGTVGSGMNMLFIAFEGCKNKVNEKSQRKFELWTNDIKEALENKRAYRKGVVKEPTWREYFDINDYVGVVTDLKKDRKDPVKKSIIKYVMLECKDGRLTKEKFEHIVKVRCNRIIGGINRELTANKAA